MSNEPTDPSADRITWGVALGLKAPDLPGWERVRVAQGAEAISRLPIVCGLHLLAAALIVGTLWPVASHTLMLGWAGTIALSFAAFMRLARMAPRAYPGLNIPDPTFQSFLRGTLTGLLWAIPSALFADLASPAQQLATCLICAGMMASFSMLSLMVPIGMLCALLFTSVGLSALMLGETGHYGFAVLPLVYAAGLGIAGTAGALVALRRSWGEYEAAESREVVSILLREFDESEADWLWQTDAAKALTNVSTRLAEAAGTSVAALEGQSLPRLLAGEQWTALEDGSKLKRLVDTLNARESFGELELSVTIGEEERWWSLSGTPRFGAEGDFLGFRGKGSDITERRRSVDRIDRMAKFDALTGLANRTHFMDHLRKALARVQAGGRRADDGCALLFVDLDRFKPVNDTLGHPVGDRLLKLVAERLRNVLGEGEVAGRLGGDEFAVLVRTLGMPARVDMLAEAVIAKLSTPFEVDGNLIRIGASVGSALGPKDGRTVETLVRHADLALYRAKDDGRGCHRRFEPALLAATNRRRAIEEGLRRALDTGALHLLYQPIADARTGEIRGFEALVRWVDPELGEVPPAAFLPIAEEARLSGRIGEWVLRTACQDAARWPGDVRVAVNLSAEQLGDKQLAATVLSALAHTGLDASRLVVELSEAVFLRGGTEVLAVMEALRGIGIGIALDDFGTGHAALAYISRGGIDTIKIDHALVHGVAAERIEAIALVRAVVALADSLGVSTVAEGVEMQEEHDGMVALGCGNVQGHLIGSPLPERSVADLLVTELRATG